MKKRIFAGIAAVVLLMFLAVSVFSNSTFNSLVSTKEEVDQLNSVVYDSVVYENSQYGFTFSLPNSWENYTIMEGKWEGLSIENQAGDTVAETGPILSIRHPLWTSKSPRQDIPIMIFTLAQWDALQEGKFHIGAAPVGPQEISRSSQYVFALPARYNYAFPEGFEEVEKILEASPLKVDKNKETSIKTSVKTSDQGIVTAPKLGGISLGDSFEKVVDVLGYDYKESTEPDFAGYIGEDMTVWNYESGIVVSIGKTSGKVLRVSSKSPDLQTDLGIKAGDDAKTVFEAYKPVYEEAVSRHSEEVLTGWFHMGDGAVMIFDFDQSDGAVVNGSITEDSRVEEIILAYWAHFD